MPANELGLWQATDGTLKALINVGPTNPKEFSEVTSTTETLKPLTQATGGDAGARSSTASSLDMPRIVPVRVRRSIFRGDGWMGVRMRDASVVKGVGVLPMFAGLIGLLLLLGAFARDLGARGPLTSSNAAAFGARDPFRCSKITVSGRLRRPSRPPLTGAALPAMLHYNIGRPG